MKMIEPKEIIRSRRRTIALEINAQGELIVRAPFRASMEQIMDFVERKQDWICDKTKTNAGQKTGAASFELHREISCIIKVNCIL